MSSFLGLTYILSLGLCDDEGASARLLRDPVIVHLPVELLPVLLPSIPDKKYFVNKIYQLSAKFLLTFPPFRIHCNACWKTRTEDKFSVTYLAAWFRAVIGWLAAWYTAVIGWLAAWYTAVVGWLAAWYTFLFFYLLRHLALIFLLFLSVFVCKFRPQESQSDVLGTCVGWSVCLLGHILTCLLCSCRDLNLQPLERRLC